MIGAHHLGHLVSGGNHGPSHAGVWVAGSPDNFVLLAGHRAGDNKVKCLGGFGKSRSADAAGSAEISSGRPRGSVNPFQIGRPGNFIVVSP